MNLFFNEIDKEVIIKKWKCFLGLCPANCPNGIGKFNGICSVYSDGPLYNCDDNDRDQIEIKIIEKLLEAQDIVSRAEQKKVDTEILFSDRTFVTFCPKDGQNFIEFLEKKRNQILNS